MNDEGLPAYPSLADVPREEIDRVSLYVPPAVGITLLEAIAAHRSWLAEGDRLAQARSVQAGSWVRDAVRTRFGSEGLKRMVESELRPDATAPFATICQAEASLGSVTHC